MALFTRGVIKNVAVFGTFQSEKWNFQRNDREEHHGSGAIILMAIIAVSVLRFKCTRGTSAARRGVRTPRGFNTIFNQRERGKMNCNDSPEFTFKCTHNGLPVTRLFRTDFLGVVCRMDIATAGGGLFI